MNIHILLPQKEFFLDKSPGAVSIMVSDQLKFSKFKKKINVYGSINIKKNYKNFFKPIKKSFFFKNKNYLKDFSKYSIKKNSIIEIHNRPFYFKYLKKKYPESKFILYFHNNPLDLKGSQTSSERQYLLNNCDHIIFLSNWIKRKFFKNLNINTKNHTVVYPGCVKLKKITKKKNFIVFVGKLNHAKGYDVFSKFASLFTKVYKNWNILSVGDEPRRTIPHNSSIKELGPLNHSKVLNLLKISKISIANSRWEEPLGRLPIESAANACVPISTDRGGLIESNTHGIILKKNSPKELYDACVKIIDDYNKFQKKVFNHYKFDSVLMNQKLDLIRESI